MGYYARNITFCDTQCGDAKKKQTKKPTKKAIKKTTKKSRNNKKKYQEISVKAKSPVVYGKTEPYRYVQPLGPMGELYKSLVWPTPGEHLYFTSLNKCNN